MSADLFRRVHKSFKGESTYLLSESPQIYLGRVHRSMKESPIMYLRVKRYDDSLIYIFNSLTKITEDS